MKQNQYHIVSTAPSESRPIPTNVLCEQAISRQQVLNLLGKIADFLLMAEPVWVSVSLGFVFTMVLTGGSHPWIGLVLAFVAYPLRLWRQGRISCRTAFDIPIAIFMAGAIVGTIVSNDLSLSLGALQTCVAGAMFYYMVVNYEQPRFLLQGMMIIACITIPLVCLSGFSTGSVPTSGANTASVWAGDVFDFFP